MAQLYRIDTVSTGLGGAPYYSTHYFDSAGGTAAAAHAAVVTYWTNLAGFIHNTFVMSVQGQIAIIESTTGDLVGSQSATPVNVSGTSNSSPNPTATQGLIQWRTNVYQGSREIRGRSYVFGTVQPQNLDGHPNPTYQTGLQTAGTALISNVQSDFVIYSRAGRVFARVNSAQAWQQWAVLRSRRD